MISSNYLQQEKNLEVMTGIDWPMPDCLQVNSKQTGYDVVYSNHGEWIGFQKRWKEDLRLLKAAGFSTVRLGIPWSMVQPAMNVFNTELLDPLVNEAEKLGIVIHYVGSHYNQPRWLKNRYDLHQCFSEMLPDALAKHSEWLVQTYGFKFYVPFVEMGTEARFRGGVGQHKAMWAPHEPGLQNRVRQCLIKAFKAGAKAARAAGAKVFCSEALDDLDVAREIAPYVDAVGFNWYLQHHYGVYGFPETFQAWSKLARDNSAELWVTEAGSHENIYPMGTQCFIEQQPYVAGRDINRMKVAALLTDAFRWACEQGYPLTKVSWYPGIANMWRTNLTCQPGTMDYCNGDPDCTSWCDRAGLFDGIDERVPCEALIETIQSWQNIRTQPVAMPQSQPQLWVPPSIIPQRHAVAA